MANQPGLALIDINSYCVHGFFRETLVGRIKHGAMTSAPALNVVAEAARSSVPALGYAGTHTFANVLLTFAGGLMMIL